jgi:hypothetical protein
MSLSVYLFQLMKLLSNSDDVLWKRVELFVIVAMGWVYVSAELCR